MTFHEVKVGGLIDFVNSEQYLNLDPKPITPERARSQAGNPSARPEDTALVYVSENSKLLAFAGSLPDDIYGEPESVFSNSGWWVHPEAGRKYGLPVFLKVFQLCRRRMFFTDCSAHTKHILERTGMFTFQKPAEGLRFIMQFYSGELLHKKGLNRFFAGCFSAADALLNFLYSFRIEAWIKKNALPGYSIQVVKKIEGELEEFIRRHSSNYYLKQGGEKLNWIIQNPWIITGEKSDTVSYPFSHVAKHFKQELLVVRKDEMPVAVILLSIRNNHASVPYIYYNENYLEQILRHMLVFLFQMKVCSLVVSNKEVLKEFDKLGIPSIYRLKIIRHFGYSNELKKFFSGGKSFQDGEGDVVFT